MTACTVTARGMCRMTANYMQTYLQVLEAEAARMQDGWQKADLLAHIAYCRALLS